jgi:phage-related protein
MPKQLSVASVIEKNRLSSDVPFLVCLDISVVDPVTSATVEMLHLVRNNENLIYNGVEYVAISFDIELKQEAGTQGSVTLTIVDYTGALNGRMEQYGGGIGFRVSVLVVNSGALDQPPEIIEDFEVIGASAADYVTSFTLGIENALAKTFPRRKQVRDFCQWRYKESGTCGYTGALPTCDLTLQGSNGCEVHQNTVNFGAFPGINNNGARYG